MSLSRDAPELHLEVCATAVGPCICNPDIPVIIMIMIIISVVRIGSMHASASPARKLLSRTVGGDAGAEEEGGAGGARTGGRARVRDPLHTARCE